MPIEVRHDVPVALSGGLAALAGTAQAQIKDQEDQRQRGRIAMQLDAQAQRQHQQIQAAAQGQQRTIEAAAERQHQNAEYAKDRIAYQAGLETELGEQKFLQEIEKKEEEARIQADQWEFKMDTTAKKQQNKYRQILNYLKTPEAAERFSPEELKSLTNEATFKFYDTPLSQYRKEPQADDNLFDDEGNNVKFNQVFTDSEGDRVYYTMSSRGYPTREVQTPYRYTKGYLNKVAEFEKAKDEREVELKAKAEYNKTWLDLAEEDIGTVAEPKKRGILAAGELMRRVWGGNLGSPSGLEPGRGWVNELTARGISVTAEERQMRPSVGRAFATLRAIKEKYGIDKIVDPEKISAIPQEDMELWGQSLSILEHERERIRRRRMLEGAR